MVYLSRQAFLHLSRFGLFCAIFSVVQGNSFTCSSSCQHDDELYNECCRCYSTPDWTLSSSKTYLEIEYVSRRGKGKVINSQERYDSQYYILSHNRGFLNSIPDNICEFPEIVEIDLRDNDIRNLTDLQCLGNLSSINLKENLIERVPNTTFIDMTELKIVDLSSNQINRIEPQTLAQDNLDFHYVYFNNNNLTQIDITNVVIETPFCNIDFSNNEVTGLSNENGWRVDANTSYGEGGYVDFSGNEFTQFFDFKFLGFDEITMLGKLVSFGFDIRNSNWTCDCKMEPLLTLVEPHLHKIWRNYYNVSCSHPEHLRGYSIPELVKNKRLDLFICNISCPKGCYCYDQPDQDRTVVNCSHRHLTSMIEHLPDGLLDIDFSFNDITDFRAMDYLNRTRSLKMNQNRITKIQSQALRFLTANPDFQRLKLEGNREIIDIPKSIQLADPCKLFFSDLTIKCDCDSFWLKQWMQSPSFIGCNHNYSWTCSTTKGSIHLLELTEEFLDCDKTNLLSVYIALALTIASALVIGLASFLYLFRYEIFILRRRITFRKNRICPNMKYDVYISVNEDNRQMLKWVVEELVPYLEQSGYRIFFPFRDKDFGVSVDDMIIQTMSLSKSFIIVISRLEDTQASLWTTKEWRHAWNNFKGSKNRNIVIVNFDYLKRRDIEDLTMKAFFRLRMVIQFHNHQHDVIKKVVERLGPPLRLRGFGLKNAKPKYISSAINTKLKYAPDDVIELVLLQDINPMYKLENAKPKLIFPD